MEGYNRVSGRPVVGVIIQARMSSTRLPKKVMMDICQRPLLWHVINRLKPASLVDEIIVATSDRPEDDIIEEKCLEWGIKCFRGSRDDVLDRYYRAALEYGIETVVRVCSDCPLIDPEVIDRAIKKYMEGSFDHVSIDKEFPHGLDCEVFSFDTLTRAWNEAALASEREHVTPYIWKNDSVFRLGKIACDIDCSHMRWTVDNRKDFDFVLAVYEAMGCSDRVFTMKEVVELLERRPDIFEINSGGIRGEGYIKSLKEDKFVKGH